MERGNINFKIKSQIDVIVSEICGYDWQNLPIDERDGAYGLAIAVSYLSGLRPSLEEFARVLNIPYKVLEVPYRRLLVNGIIKHNSWLYWNRHFMASDPINLSAIDYESWHKDWSFVASLASGFLGKGYNRSELSEIIKNRKI